MYQQHHSMRENRKTNQTKKLPLVNQQHIELKKLMSQTFNIPDRILSEWEEAKKRIGKTF